MASTKRRKPGSWNTRKKNRFKRELHKKQEGICPFCNWYFDITRMCFYYVDGGYILTCVECHP